MVTSPRLSGAGVPPAMASTSTMCGSSPCRAGGKRSRKPWRPSPRPACTRSVRGRSARLSATTWPSLRAITCTRRPGWSGSTAQPRISPAKQPSTKPWTRAVLPLGAAAAGTASGKARRHSALRRRIGRGGRPATRAQAACRRVVTRCSRPSRLSSRRSQPKRSRSRSSAAVTRPRRRDASSTNRCST